MYTKYKFFFNIKTKLSFDYFFIVKKFDSFKIYKFFFFFVERKYLLELLWNINSDFM